MSSDYLELLDPTSLGLLAETTGVAPRSEASRFFSEHPTGIRLALGSPEAARLLDQFNEAHHHRRLQIAIAVHRTAEQICSAGWSAGDESPIDMSLLSFAGQGSNQALMLDLLASYLPAPAELAMPEIADLAGPAAPPGSPRRMIELVELCAEVGETERAGALRLLGDEALFSAGLAPVTAARTVLTDDLLAQLETVLPRVVRDLLPEIRPQLQSQLDAYLQFGPVWYRMASQNLLHRNMRQSLSELAREFAQARRFLVRVAQGPLHLLKEDLFATSV